MTAMPLGTFIIQAVIYRNFTEKCNTYGNRYITLLKVMENSWNLKI